MMTRSPIAEELRRLLTCPGRDVVATVDEVLVLCGRERLSLDWRPELCRYSHIGNGAEEIIVAPLHRSHFRALLARVAHLCNERSADVVSLYQGECVISVDGKSPEVRVIFANTPDEQRLQITPLS